MSGIQSVAGNATYESIVGKRFKEMEMTQQLENWVSHELKVKSTAKILTMCEFLLQKQK